MESTYDIDRKRLEEFTATLQQNLAYQEQTTRRLDQHLATRFNVFAFIGNKEDRLSDILQDLLDPMGSHGQGAAFLRLFLYVLGRRLPNGNGDLLRRDLGHAIDRCVSDANCQVTVAREVRTSRIAAQGRKIDLVVEAGEYAVAIENKPHAREQVDQVQAYAEHLAHHYPAGWCLIYLTPHGDKPHSIEAPEAKRLRERGNLVEMAYATDIREWLTACIATCNAEKTRWFLRDFLEHVTKSFPPPVLDASHEY